MERISITERPDWREKATEYGFNFHTMYGEPYWSEEAYYKLTLAQVEKLEEVTAGLHQMCLQAVEKVVASDELMAKFRIPKHTWGFVRQSWKTNQPSLYSRLDLAWDGVGEPKLLENNADTPTSLYEAAFFQWIWLEDQINAGQLPAGSDQFNSLQEKLIERFPSCANSLASSCCIWPAAAIPKKIAVPCSICRTVPQKRVWRPSFCISKISAWVKKVSLPTCRIR